MFQDSLPTTSPQKKPSSDRIYTDPSQVSTTTKQKLTLRTPQHVSSRYNISSLSSLDPQKTPQKWKRNIFSQLSNGIDSSLSKLSFLKERLSSETSKYMKRELPFIAKSQVDHFQSKLTRIVSKYNRQQDQYQKMRKRIKSTIQERKMEYQMRVPRISHQKVEFKETKYDQRLKGRIEQIYKDRYSSLRNNLGNLDSGKCSMRRIHKSNRLYSNSEANN